MKIVVVGAGGVGGYFGGRLAEAGHKVTFVVREPHFSVIKAHGLKLLHPEGELTVMPEVVKSFEKLEDIDLIILATKSWQLPEVAKQFKNYLQEKTLVLPLQNGVGSVDKLSEIIPKKKYISCILQNSIQSRKSRGYTTFKLST